MSGKKPGKKGKGKEMSRREFLWEAGMLFGTGIIAGTLHSIFKYVQMSKEYSKLMNEELPLAKYIDLEDRKEGKRFPLLDVYKALCRRENYERMTNVIGEHIDGLNQFGYSMSEFSQEYSPENLRKCMGIVSEITGFKPAKEPEIKPLKDWSKAYGYTAASVGGIGLTVLARKFLPEGKAKRFAPDLFSFFSGLAFLQALSSYSEERDQDTAGEQIAGEHVPGSKDIKVGDPTDAKVMIHEGAHLVFDQSGADRAYGKAISGGFAGGVALLGSKVYDRENGRTNFRHNAESDIIAKVIPLHDHISRSKGYRQPGNLFLMKQSIRNLYSGIGESPIDEHGIGYALFQILEKEHGPEIYKQILKKEDRLFDDFIYRRK